MSTPPTTALASGALLLQAQFFQFTSIRNQKPIFFVHLGNNFIMHILIIGNGISGITLARYIRKFSNHQITIVSSETKHFYSRTALMYIYMRHMRFEDTKPYEDHFWKKNRISLVHDHVEKVEPEVKNVVMRSGEALHYDKLVIATGSVPNKFGWKGENLNGVQGLYSYQDLELMEKNTANIEKAVIVGGGLIGIEMAEMLRARNIKLTFLLREKHYFGSTFSAEEGEIINKHILEHGVDLRLETELDEILDDGNGNVAGIVTKSGEKLDCQFVGLTVGVSPNVRFLENSGIEMGKGVLVDEFFQTNLEDVYAIGDCAEFKNPAENHPKIEQLWYTGKMHGEILAHTICKSPISYLGKRGIWFNSAKFFDIEYQTYGAIPNNIPEDQSAFFWKNAKKSLRIQYDSKTRKILGMNALGLRHRHIVWEEWIKSEKTVDYVLEHLHEANFDPEFFKKYETEIRLFS